VKSARRIIGGADMYASNAFLLGFNRAVAPVFVVIFARRLRWQFWGSGSYVFRSYAARRATSSG
jgi:hypothetical protein